MGEIQHCLQTSEMGSTHGLKIVIGFLIVTVALSPDDQAFFQYKSSYLISIYPLDSGHSDGRRSLVVSACRALYSTPNGKKPFGLRGTVHRQKKQRKKGTQTRI
jgi:hypothetical protein